MGIRNIILLATVIGSLPFCFLRPWIGILVFSWLGYMNPHRFTWGMAYEFPVAQLVALATLAGFIFTGERDKFHLERETLLILLLWFVFTMNTFFFAMYPGSARTLWEQTTKVFLMCLLTIPLFCDEKRLRYLYLTIAFSLGLLAVKGAIFAVVTGGAYNVRGPDKSFISGEGEFGLALNMILPILFYLPKGEKNGKLRLLLRITFLMTTVSIIFTYRRGAFLTLAAVILILLFKSRQKIVGVIVLTFLVLFASIYVPQKWSERMGTISTYQQDGSAMGRIYAWQMAWNVAKDRPFTGAGFEGLGPGTIGMYSPNPDATASDVHSIYFEILGEQGFIAFGLFIALFCSCFLSLRKIKRIFKGSPNERFCNYADMLQVSIIAYMVGGAFLGRGYFDLYYHLVCTIVVLKVMAKRKLESAEQESTSGIQGMTNRLDSSVPVGAP